MRPNGAIVWDVNGGQPLAGIPHTRSAFDPSRRRLLTEERGKTTLWDLVSGRALSTIACYCAVSNAVFSSDGRLFAVIDESEGLVRVCSTVAGRFSRDLNSDGAVTKLALSRDGRLIAYASTEPPPPRGENASFLGSRY